MVSPYHGFPTRGAGTPAFAWSAGRVYSDRSDSHGAALSLTRLLVPAAPETAADGGHGLETRGTLVVVGELVGHQQHVGVLLPGPQRLRRAAEVGVGPPLVLHAGHGGGADLDDL